ncbi:hypothetical protein [Aureimonas sp. Leaf324]|uniref:hypothetical protein n=1 Tax=Aureimonas sp. Leaf324 TaxID=1736336 RepID=UPI001FCD9801|nr:hypothetical protein [Aureimonas sp. Leaf324]
MSKIAPDFSISGTALAAICHKHRIPYPGSGYWTRKGLGLAVELPPLPDSIDETIEIMAAPAKPRLKRLEGEAAASTRKRASRPPLPPRHPILFGVEEHFRKTRAAERGEFLRPYKRILPDVRSSEASLSRALSIANDVYVALRDQQLDVRIAQAGDDLHGIHVDEQEVALKDRRYGRYHSGGIWSPDRPTVFTIGAVPIGLALIEMTERVTMRYYGGDYHREDSHTIRSARPWQLANSWTTEQDMPSGRFRLVAYSPKRNVDWSLRWQEADGRTLQTLTAAIVEELKASADRVQRLMDAEERAAAERAREAKERWERYEREEDVRKAAQAIVDSQKQLSDIIERWGKAVTVERFFTDIAQRLDSVDTERRECIGERVALAKAMLGSTDPLKFIEDWVSPVERYRSKF